MIFINRINYVQRCDTFLMYKMCLTRLNKVAMIHIIFCMIPGYLPVFGSNLDITFKSVVGQKVEHILNSIMVDSQIECAVQCSLSDACNSVNIGKWNKYISLSWTRSQHMLYRITCPVYASTSMHNLCMSFIIFLEIRSIDQLDLQKLM